MFNTFNMGVGMCVVVAPEDADAAVKALRAAGEDAYVLGDAGTGRSGRCDRIREGMGANMKNIVVLVSGGGTNLQALIDAQTRGEIIGGRIAQVISSNPEAYALTRAEQAGISTAVVQRQGLFRPEGV